MNIKNKINGIESAAIGLSFLGTVAAIVTQQVAYAATPLTLSLSLSLINKQKELVKVNTQLANLEQQLTTELKAISQQSQAAIDSVRALPPTPTALDLERLSEGMNEEIKRLRIILAELEGRDDNLSPFLKEIDLTKDSIKQLSLEFSTFQQEFERDRDSTRVTLLDASHDAHSLVADPNNIAPLENLIGKHTDSELTRDTQALITEIKQKIQSLEINSRVAEDSIQQVGWRFLELEKEFASRPELAEINRIDRSSIEMGKEVETISQKLSQTQTDHSLKLTELELDRDNIQASLAANNQQIQLLEDNTADRSLKLTELELDRDNIQISIAANNRQLQLLEDNTADHSLKLTEIELDRDNIQASIVATKQQIQLLENNPIVTELVDRVNDLDTSLSDLHDYNLKLSNRINDYTRYEIAEIINDAVIERNISNLIQQEIGNSIAEQFEIIKQVLPQNYSYELVSGRVESRQILLDALAQSQERLILVCPWLTEYAVNRQIQNLLKAALDRGISIEIGWGHLKDVNNDRSQLSKENLVKSNDWAYNAVPWLYELQNRYPDLLKLKILGTHEKFLVCDRQFAMVGSHNYLTSDTKSSEREVGIKTDSPELIDKLIQLFDSIEA